MCHAYVRSDSLVGLCFSDHEYPNRVAHTLLTKILEEFTAQVPRSQWTEGKEVAGFAGPLDVHLKKFQNPAEADPMMKVQTELDETKIILHNTIELVNWIKLIDLFSFKTHFRFIILKINTKN